MDLRKVKTLIDLVQQSDVTELEITEGEERVRISRNPLRSSQAMQPFVAGDDPAQATVLQPTPVSVPQMAPASAPEPEGFVLKTPMVGTFYLSSAPGGKALVEVGDSVKVDTAVCIVEAMKLMNEIEAGAAGRVKQILVENAQPVEYGQPLMIIVSSS